MQNKKPFFNDFSMREKNSCGTKKEFLRYPQNLHERQFAYPDTKQ